MPVEIERKFLVEGDAWRDQAGQGVSMRQGYLARARGCTVRVRVAGDSAWLTLKGETSGVSRTEFEYPIPVADAERMLAEMCAGGRIDKTRYVARCAGHDFEVDVFSGENEGLVLAEIELDSEHQHFERPAWLGPEVSDDARYYNAELSVRPFSTW